MHFLLCYFFHPHDILRRTVRGKEYRRKKVHNISSIIFLNFMMPNNGITFTHSIQMQFFVTFANRDNLHTQCARNNVAGATRPCNSIFGENYLFV